MNPRASLIFNKLGIFGAVKVKRRTARNIIAACNGNSGYIHGVVFHAAADSYHSAFAVCSCNCLNGFVHVCKTEGSVFEHVRIVLLKRIILQRNCAHRGFPLPAVFCRCTGCSRKIRSDGIPHKRGSISSDIFNIYRTFVITVKIVYNNLHFLVFVVFKLGEKFAVLGD